MEEENAQFFNIGTIKLADSKKSLADSTGPKIITIRL